MNFINLCINQEFMRFMLGVLFSCKLPIHLNCGNNNKKTVHSISLFIKFVPKKTMKFVEFCFSPSTFSFSMRSTNVSGFFYTTSEMDSNIFRCKMQFAWNFFVFLTQNINANLLYIEAVKRNTLILAIDMPKCDTQLHFKQMVWWVVVVVSHSLVDVCQQFKAGCWFFCFEAQWLCGIDGNGIGWLKKCAFDS